MPATEATARVSTKAQLVLPKRIRERLGISPGDIVRFVERDGSVVIERLEPESTEDPFALFGEWSSPADVKAYGKL
ncbi:MAG: AbrB/MazE/SpoVT family DNA-binding domain-containing protein [Geminicoccaceae bacterium]